MTGLLPPAVSAKQKIQPAGDGRFGEQVARRGWDGFPNGESVSSHFEGFFDREGAPIQLVERHAMDDAFAAAQRQAPGPGEAALAGKYGANRQGGGVMGGFRKAAVGDGSETLSGWPPGTLSSAGYLPGARGVQRMP